MFEPTPSRADEITSHDDLTDLVDDELADEYVATGDAEALRAARSTVDGVHNLELREGLKRESRGYERLATGSGREFERAKAWALDEGLTPWRMLKRVDNARYEFDNTYEQQERLKMLARKWLEENRELQA